MSTEQHAYQIGFDVGGTSLKAALVSAQGQIQQIASAPTPIDALPSQMIAVMAELIQQLQVACTGQLTGVGIGMAGLIDAQQGLVVTSPNLPTWKDVPICQLLSEQVGLPVAIDNDVRAMAMGELRYGAGQGCQDMICLTLGTGVGSALIFNGQIYRGVSLSAGEFGHVTVVPQGGRTCGCGNRGCLETVAGTAGILDLAQRFVDRGLAPELQGLLATEPLTPKAIAVAAAAGDSGAQAVWQEVGHWLGLALAGVVNLLNPARIVIGGGVAQAGELLFPAIRAALLRHAFERPAQAVTVLPAALGAEAGMIGAAVLAQKEGK